MPAIGRWRLVVIVMLVWCALPAAGAQALQDDTYAVPALCGDGGGLRSVSGALVHHGSLSFSPTVIAAAAAPALRAKPGTVSALVTYSIYAKPGNFIRVGLSAKIVDYLDFLYLVGKVSTDWEQPPSDPLTDLNSDGRLEFGDIAEFGKLYGQ